MCVWVCVWVWVRVRFRVRVRVRVRVAEMAEIGGTWRPVWAIGAEAREGGPPGVVVLLVVLLVVVAAAAVAVVVVVPLATWAPTSGESIGHRLTPEERESMPGQG